MCLEVVTEIISSPDDTEYPGWKILRDNHDGTFNAPIQGNGAPIPLGKFVCEYDYQHGFNSALKLQDKEGTYYPLGFHISTDRGKVLEIMLSLGWIQFMGKNGVLCRVTARKVHTIGMEKTSPTLVASEMRIDEVIGNAWDEWESHKAEILSLRSEPRV